VKSYSNALVKTIWEKIRTAKTLTIFEWMIFVVLFCLSIVYRIGFSIALTIKTKKHSVIIPGTKIISVGNISVGGTGKTIVTEFLVHIFEQRNSVVVLRGYKGSNEKTRQSIVVSDGSQVFCTAEVSGDEASMLATSLQIPIIVGSNRASSCMLASKLFKPQIIILDDAYQNFHVRKDIQILLLDARKPFENGYVLPAGPLREKDISRADCIILTHANEIPSQTLELLKQTTLRAYNQAKIFSGKHQFDGIYLNNQGLDAAELVIKKRFLAVAGIGSVTGFLRTLSDAGMIVGAVIDLEDHHHYTPNDLEAIARALNHYDCQTVVTTAKDWAKLSHLIMHAEEVKKLPIYVVRITFEFLSHNEYSSFKRFLEIE
jgi:tetraacyldisaccharide 4'-kinase